MLQSWQHVSATVSHHQATKRNKVLVHSVIVHSMRSHIVYILYYKSYVG